MKSDLKHFILRALARMEGLPMRETELVESAMLAFERAKGRTPSVADIGEAKRELQFGGYIHGTEDEMDRSMSWTLTPRGKHKAMQLG